MTGQGELWTAAEARLQAEQVRGQLDVWDAIAASPCQDCGAGVGVACLPFCLGLAAHADD